MEEQVVADSASSVVTALLEYGAMGIFAIYLIVTNWFAQKRIDQMTDTIATQLTDQTAKLDAIIKSKEEDKLKKDIAKMIESNFSSEAISSSTTLAGSTFRLIHLPGPQRALIRARSPSSTMVVIHSS